MTAEGQQAASLAFLLPLGAIHGPAKLPPLGTLVTQCHICALEQYTGRKPGHGQPWELGGIVCQPSAYEDGLGGVGRL